MGGGSFGPGAGRGRGEIISAPSPALYPDRGGVRESQLIVTEGTRSCSCARTAFCALKWRVRDAVGIQNRCSPPWEVHQAPAVPSPLLPSSIQSDLRLAVLVSSVFVPPPSLLADVHTELRAQISASTPHTYTTHAHVHLHTHAHTPHTELSSLVDTSQCSGQHGQSGQY